MIDIVDKFLFLTQQQYTTSKQETNCREKNLKFGGEKALQWTLTEYFPHKTTYGFITI